MWQWENQFFLSGSGNRAPTCNDLERNLNFRFWSRKNLKWPELPARYCPSIKYGGVAETEYSLQWPGIQQKAGNGDLRGGMIAGSKRRGNAYPLAHHADLMA